MPDETAGKRFAALSQEWFSVSLGYLTVVPELTRKNFEHVEGKMTKEVVEIAKKRSLANHISMTEDGTKVEQITVSRDELSVLLRHVGKSIHVPEAAVAMSKSSLGALIADYEAFMSNLLRTLAKLQPKVFIPDDETVSVLSLEGFTSFDDFVDDLIDDKIQGLMQEKSHLQILKWIEEKYKVNLTSNEEMIRDFVEIAQRRNIIAHAGGKVNKRYLKICSEIGIAAEKLPKLGEHLTVDEQYLRRATARVFLVGFFTLHIMWQKVLSKQREDSLRSILAASHDFLDSDLTKMCRRLCQFCLSTSKEMPARLKTYFTINLAQSYLFDPAMEETDRQREVESVLRKCDFSMIPPTVELALACLRRNFSDLDGLTKRAVLDGMTYYDAMTWSILREVRSREEFVRHFEAGK